MAQVAGHAAETCQSVNLVVMKLVNYALCKRMGIISTEGDSAQVISISSIPLSKGSSAEKHVEIDYHLYEFGSVEYHIQSPAADPNHNYLSISTPMLFQGVHQSYGFSRYTKQMIKEACSDAVEIVEPPREGYQLTLKLDFSKIPNEKGLLLL
ncbi:hypothetical protein GH714_005380 [Hevea brasiliensis]|uniref:Uncharacterized protein n=1 Tax=Hevea brasiliensis TaxID=3981 RepID=A0A6A6KDG5_HEVBR|nr:hypothetical protein GH714_005380 [Hevea brasiliensis]